MKQQLFPSELLTIGIKQLELNSMVPLAIQDKLIKFLKLLQKWNKVYNLTAIDDLESMVSYHLLDSLAIVKHITNCQQILDVGSGAGLPGIVLAIVCPKLSVILLDSNSKKTAFLQQVAIELKLNNVTVVNSRVEDYFNQNIAGIIARAFARLPKMLASIQHLVTANSKIFILKGPAIKQELNDLPANFMINQRLELTIPFLNQQRYLLELKFNQYHHG